MQMVSLPRPKPIAPNVPGRCWQFCRLGSKFRGTRGRKRHAPHHHNPPGPPKCTPTYDWPVVRRAFDPIEHCDQPKLMEHDMSLKTLALGGAMALLALPAFAGDVAISIEDAYARSGAKSGAAFFVIMNKSDTDDRLVAASTDAAPRVELHTHIEDENGVMKMREVEAGFPVPAGGMHALERGGDHVMFMGLDQPLPEGESISVTLTFENAGDVVVEIPVDNDRKPKHGHGGHNHDG